MKTMIILMVLACAGCGQANVLLFDENGCRYVGTTYEGSLNGSLKVLMGADGKQVCLVPP